MIYLLSGKEFDSNMHSNLVRKTQVASAFLIKSSAATILRVAVMFSLTFKAELPHLIGVESEETSWLKRRLSKIYTDEFSAFLPALSGIILISLCMVDSIVYHQIVFYLKFHLFCRS